MEVELDDGIRPFIELKMSEVDNTIYNKEEFKTFFLAPHRIFAVINSLGHISAFCTLKILNEGHQMCYTWCDGTREGKKAYLHGIHYMIENYAPLSFAEGAIKLNKIRRLKEWIEAH